MGLRGYFTDSHQVTALLDTLTLVASLAPLSNGLWDTTYKVVTTRVEGGRGTWTLPLIFQIYRPDFMVKTYSSFKTKRKIFIHQQFISIIFSETIPKQLLIFLSFFIWGKYDHWLRAEKGLGTSHYYGFQGKRRGGKRVNYSVIANTA